LRYSHLFFILAAKPVITEDMTQDSTCRRDFLKAAGGAPLTMSLFTGDLKGANDKLNVETVPAPRNRLTHFQ